MTTPHRAEATPCPPRTQVDPWLVRPTTSSRTAQRRLAVLRAAAVGACLLGCGPAATREPTPPPADPVMHLDGRELLRRGVALASRGDLVRAEQYLVAAMQRGEPPERVLPVLLRVCIAASRLRAALDYATPHLERNPHDWALRLVVASIHLGLDRPQRARVELERVVAQVPDRPEGHYLLAVVLRDHAADLERARHHFERYLELAPQGPHAAEAVAAIQALGPRPVQQVPTEPSHAEGAP
ncbi:MAG: tetratricopeptide repeat protein [Myxococcota bacterium]|nr:tetratricopeptide repeat protein [Myxococcota bacterium]MDW8363777.1 tetratricopeptide repeat protein [Myxococcales bacterium]